MDGLEKLLTKLPEMVTSFSALGLPGWIAGGVLALVLGVGGFFLARWIKKRKIAAAEKKTLQKRDEAERAIVKENKAVESDASAAEKEIEDRLKGGR